ncbi:acetyl/propionyl/methylcrotonyl-CoA carboxylase subunit alpha [Pontixanthobacter aquaemixtae]|uniref:ATP-grasp domain-containing protein n=1 Tax=Pontixanthobacter aquaemixtae TaxID=1958940 RepID=A0A844ZXC2_9SPHN|nr:acetyl/propionyl/methylcrotonyl-CoA carboxylase subunit alpha [Pontixanthobacter aquaemixtae]MXO91882.1 ATP-grasp domain-containing protein [Pontixanthobacter aquaemixtae]
MINKLLIANRGEIACRIMRTAREMGISTVAVYSDADAKALHTRSADEAVHIGPSPAAESYLVGEKIIAAAKETGADAIHPGYGFLSENADFAQEVQDAGLIWVGPNPDSIRDMGLKDAAKERMIAAGVPVTPGYLGDDQTVERLTKEAEAIGYPVLIKAVAGGGGKGMRKVDKSENFAADLESCRREAKASFGNDDVLLEKWITSPRHIEVQVFGDSHGNVVHLFERDCSLQRRHQKVIEEAPAPGMDAATREEICCAAIRAAKAVDYVGAGTIEFIADASEGLRADRIFFMEMNTRLQVEHPVTEEITGVDLVEWQLRVASGEPIPLKQDELSINGHAIEARLYAEDPAKGFLPSPGPVDEIFQPGDGRLEWSVEDGDAVTAFYDPMIAKVINHADDRNAARTGLMRILNSLVVYPITTNKAFLFECLDLPEFVSGELDTSLIERQEQRLLEVRPPSQDVIVSAASRFRHDWLDWSGIGWDERNFREGTFGFRLNAGTKSEVTLFHDEEVYSAKAETFAGKATADHVNPDTIVVTERGRTYEFTAQPPRDGGHAATSDGAILAPMPGKVIAVDVAEGDTVTAGQRLMVLEAMKMEHGLTAPFDGTVTELAASVGGQVQVEAVLAVVEPANQG